MCWWAMFNKRQLSLTSSPSLLLHHHSEALKFFEHISHFWTMECPLFCTVLYTEYCRSYGFSIWFKKHGSKLNVRDYTIWMQPYNASPNYIFCQHLNSHPPCPAWRERKTPPALECQQVSCLALLPDHSPPPAPTGYWIHITPSTPATCRLDYVFIIAIVSWSFSRK